MMFLRFILAKLLEAVGALIGIILFPLVYAFRFQIDNNPGLYKKLGLWYLTNQDEANHIENWYGFYELKPEVADILLEYNRMTAWQKFWLSYKWVAFRNPSWQLKLAIGKHIDCEPCNETIYKVVGNEDGMTWRDKTVTGFQYATFYMCGKKCFRFSFTKKIFGKWVNVMLGAKRGRYVSKFRIFNELGRWG